MKLLSKSLLLSVVAVSSSIAASIKETRGSSKSTEPLNRSEIQHVVLLGDSYTDRWNEFNFMDGWSFWNRPAAPAGRGSNFEMWPYYVSQYLPIEYINMAYSGATVDWFYIFQGPYKGIKQQVHELYMYFGGGHSNSSLSERFPSSSTMYIIWIGINDLNVITLDNPQLDVSAHEGVLQHLWASVDELYAGGARHFTFLNVPPLDQTPLWKTLGSKNQTIHAQNIANYNSLLMNKVSTSNKSYKDASFVLFDAHSVFTEILANPSSYGIDNTNIPCDNNTGVLDCHPGSNCRFDFGADQMLGNFECFNGANATKYMWFNGMHPTDRVHQIIGQKFYDSL
jgi:phospholipase/lecithinase/hemolysin